MKINACPVILAQLMRLVASGQNAKMFCCFFLVCFLSSASYKSFIVTDDMPYSSDLGMTKGYVAIITIHLCYMYVVVVMVTTYNCVFTFHLQISQSNLIQHHTLLMKLMVLFPSRLLLTRHYPQQTTVLHCSTQWMARLLVRDTLVDTITNSTSALV